MKSRSPFALALLGLLTAVVAPGRVCAQGGDVQPPEVRRPYRGIFAPPADLSSTQALDLTISVFGAYDEDVYADQGSLGLAPELRQSGWFEGAQGALVYSKRGRRVGFGADAGAGVTRYPDQPLFVSYRGGVTLGAQVARHTNLSLAETVVYAPEFRLGLFVSPTDPGRFADPFLPLTPELGVFRERSYRTITGVGLTQTFRDRATLEGYYSLATANYSDQTLNYYNQGVGARYVRRLTRNAGLRLGYGYGTGRYPNAPAFSRRGVHTIDAGVDYGRALSVSRRTSFGFSTGSALFYANQGIAGQGDYRLDYALLGSANLTHEMGRTWTASVAYRRSVDFHEGFVDPFLAQSVSADVRGMLSRRLRFSSSVAYGRGVIGVRSNNNFATTNANAGLEYGLTRFLALYANYVYYQYSFDTAVAIDPRFPRSLDRNGVRFGLTTSLPLMRAK